MTREYFDDHCEKFKQITIIGEICCRKAEFYKCLYKVTGWKWAKDKNQYYYEKGMKLLIGGLGVCLVDLAILDKYMKDMGE